MMATKRPKYKPRANDLPRIGQTETPAQKPEPKQQNEPSEPVVEQPKLASPTINYVTIKVPVMDVPDGANIRRSIDLGRRMPMEESRAAKSVALAMDCLGHSVNGRPVHSQSQAMMKLLSMIAEELNR